MVNPCQGLHASFAGEFYQHHWNRTDRQMLEREREIEFMFISREEWQLLPDSTDSKLRAISRHKLLHRMFLERARNWHCFHLSSADQGLICSRLAVALEASTSQIRNAKIAELFVRLMLISLKHSTAPCPSNQNSSWRLGRIDLDWLVTNFRSDVSVWVEQTRHKLASSKTRFQISLKLSRTPYATIRNIMLMKFWLHVERSSLSKMS